MKDTTTQTTVVAINGKEYNVPEAYICPISLDIMTHPLVSRSGHRFERSAIQAWLAKAGVNPLTRQPMGLRDLIPDYHLEDEIRFWKENHDIIPRNFHHHGDDGAARYEEDYSSIVLFTPVIDKNVLIGLSGQRSSHQGTSRGNQRRSRRRIFLNLWR